MQARMTCEPLRVALFATHPRQFNGYSKVVHELCRAVVGGDAAAAAAGRRRVQMHVFGFQNFHDHPAHRRDVPIEVQLYDANAHEVPHQGGFGVSLARAYVERVRPHVAIVFNDMKVLTTILEQLKDASNRAEFRVIAYIDQVYLSQHGEFVETVNRLADAAMAFTPEWRECIVWQGLRVPCHVLDHGFNPLTNHPVPRRVVRRYYGVPEEDFLVLNLNRNQPRKRWDTCMQAFAEVVALRPEARIRLVVATQLKCAWDLGELLQRELRKRGVPDPAGTAAARIYVPGHPQMLTDFETNLLYNLADIGINTCDGEGFGLCNFEQAALGIPQVVPRVGGFVHFFDDACAQLVDPVTSIYVDALRDGVGGEAQLSRPTDFAQAILRYYDDAALRARHGAAARAKILAKFPWSRVAGDLRDILDAVCPAAARTPASAEPAIVCPAVVCPATATAMAVAAAAAAATPACDEPAAAAAATTETTETTGDAGCVSTHIAEQLLAGSGSSSSTLVAAEQQPLSATTGGDTTGAGAVDDDEVVDDEIAQLERRLAELTARRASRQQ